MPDSERIDQTPGAQFKPDAWMLDLARSVNELVSTPERLCRFRDQLEDWLMRKLIRFSEKKDWEHRRKWHEMNGRISARLRDREAGPPPNHPDWVMEHCRRINCGVWMPSEFTLANEPDTSLPLPLKGGEPTLWTKYTVLAVLHDGTLCGVERIILSHDPQSNTSGDEWLEDTRAISFLLLFKQLPKLTERDRPALEKYLADVRADLKVPTPAASDTRTESPAVPSDVLKQRTHKADSGNRLKRDANIDLVKRFIDEKCGGLWDGSYVQLEAKLDKELKLKISDSTLQRHLKNDKRKGAPHRAAKGRNEREAAESYELPDPDAYTMPDDIS